MIRASVLLGEAKRVGRLGQTDRAREKAHEAYALLKDTTGDESLGYAKALLETCHILPLEESHTNASRGAAIAWRHYLDAVEHRSAREQFAIAADFRWVVDNLIALAAQPGRAGLEDTELAWAWLVRWKGTLTESTGPSMLAPMEAAELRELAGKLRQLRQVNTLSNDQQREFIRLTERREALETQARRELSTRLAVNPTTEAAAVKSAIPQGAVLLDYVRYDEPEPRYVLFIIWPDKPTALVELGKASAVEARIDSWLASLRYNAVSDPAGVRRTVFGDAADTVADAKTLLICPDGIFHRVPWYGLPGAKNGRLLIEEQSAVVVPYPRLLLARKKEAPEAVGEGVLVVGNVEFGNAEDPPRTAFTVPTHTGTFPWRPLPGTKSEITSIEQIMQERKVRTTLLTGNEATEDNFLRVAPRFRVLHIATHGYYAPEQNRPVGATAPASIQALLNRPRVAGWHPDLLAGLVFAGANHPRGLLEADGIATAMEIASLDLRTVKLAVLSACETALGQSTSSEGVVSLQRAFAVAGVDNVVSSVWAVDDRATALLMQEFYRRLFSDKETTPSVALRDAQLWMLKSGRQAIRDSAKEAIALGDETRGLEEIVDELDAVKDGRLPPYYWAGFVLSGDWK
jgi:CHAT domain-containing protein